MVGYVLQKGVTFDESTDIQGQDRLIQVASPNSTDRYTYYPKVSQGDWSGGERQLFFVDPTKYYQTDGNVDITKAGQLGVLPTLTTVAVPAAFRSSISQPAPIVTTYQGTVLVGGGAASGTANMMALTASAPITGTVGAAATDPVLDLYILPSASATNNDVVCAVSGSLYRTNFTLSTNAQVTNALTVETSSGPGMAYFNRLLYYANGNAIRSNDLAGVDTAVITFPAPYGRTTFFIPTANGALYGLGNNSISALTTLYSFDGSSSITPVGVLQGFVVFATEVSGVVWLLAASPQHSLLTAVQYTLYSFTGGSLSVVDDTRFILPDFQSVNNAGGGALNPFGYMYSDGRFLYIGWGNGQFSQFDLASTQSIAISNIGTSGRTATNEISAVVPSGGGFPATRTFYVTQSSGTLRPTVQARVTGGTPATGVLTTSFFDFSTPTTTKVFRSFEIETIGTVAPANITVAYKIDNQSAFTTLTTITSPHQNTLICYFPVGVKGNRVQFQITIAGGGASPGPQVRSYSVNARLGRIWKTTVQVPRRLLLHDGTEEARTAQALIANIQNCYKLTSGYCTLFIPNPSVAAGAEQVNAYVESYTWKSAKPGPTTDSQPGGSFDQGEGLIDLAIVEQV